jgi:uncharacterized protein YndB with AHSA1/START domain
MDDDARALTLEPDRSSRHSAGIHASPAEVYEAITDPRALSHWFLSEASIDLRPGGAYRWVFGDATGTSGPDAQVASGEFVAILPQESIRMKSRVRDLDTDLEFRLDPWRDGAVLTVTHGGFPGDESWDETFRSIDEGWESEIQILKFYLEKARGMIRRSHLHETRLPVPVEEAYLRFTTQAGLCSWLAERAAADPSPGGEFLLEWEGKESIRGRFAVANPERLLVMTWEGDSPSVVRVWFEEDEDGRGSTISLEHRLFAANRDGFQPWPWNEALARLAEAVTVGPAA